MTARKNMVVKDEVFYAFICQLAKANKKEILAGGLKARIIDVRDLSKAAQQIALEKVVDNQALNLLLSMGANSDYAVSGAAFAGHADLVDSLIGRGAEAHIATEAAAYGGQFSLVEQLVNRHTVLLFFPAEGALNGHQFENVKQAYDALLSFQDPKLRLRFAKEVDNRQCLDFKLCSLLITSDSVNESKHSSVSSIGVFFRNKHSLRFASTHQNANAEKKKFLTITPSPFLSH